MNIDDLTIGQIKQIKALFPDSQVSNVNATDTFKIGENVIIRTYSAGVWFGVLYQKSGNEVILKDARRMWKWWAAESISLSGVANCGINRAKSKIAPAVESVWLEAIEILSLSKTAIDSIRGADNAKAE